MAVFDLNNTMGAAFIGVVIAAVFYGVSVLQVYYYYTHQTDKWPVKTLVGLVMLFETVHQILITHSVYFYVITSYGQAEKLQQLIWSLLVEVLFNGLTALLVQSFLTMRVWRLSNRRVWLTGFSALLVIGEFGSVIAFTALSLQLKTYVELTQLKGLSITVNALAAAADLLIAGSLCVTLHQSRTGFQKSDTMIKKLIMYSVNTGVLTSLCAVASLVSILVAGDTFLYIMFFFCIGRLYSNSLLATLNARKRIRAAGEAVENTSSGLSFSLHDFSRTARLGVNTVKRPGDISIKVDTTKEFSTDMKRQHGVEDRGIGMRPLEEKDELGMVLTKKASGSTTVHDSPVASAV